MRLPLIGGAYSARSVIAACTRAVNLYPEVNPKLVGVVPMTHYQRPGMRFVVHDSGNTSAPVRQTWSRTDGNGAYVVIGNTVYWLDNGLALHNLGTIGSSTGWVSITDNGVTAMLVDGSATGYFISMASNALTTISDSSGVFTGGSSVDTMDTFMLWSFVGATNFFGSTLAGSATFNGLYFAAKASFPDPIKRLIVNKRQILLLGSKRSEIWYNAGGAQFPFQLLPGPYVQHGTIATASAAWQNIEVYWLAANEQGQGMVMMQRGYETHRISNHALEYAIRQMAAQGTIADAIGFTTQVDGHVFYVLTFPTGDQTWVYDAAISDPADAWHQWAWTDRSGGLHRSRANCGAFLPNAVLSATGQVGVFIVGDWQNGALYALDANYYYDDALENINLVGQPPATSAAPISFIRTFAHIGIGRAQGTPQPAETDGRRIKYNWFEADMDCGQVLPSDDPAPKVSLRWSDDRGNTWSNAIEQPYGPVGNYADWPTWRTLGIARDRVFELSFSCGGKTALNGAWVDAEVLDS